MGSVSTLPFSVAVIVGVFVAALVPSRPSAKPGWLFTSTRTRVTLGITLVAATLGSSALGSATAVATSASDPGTLQLWASENTKSIAIDVTVGAEGDWEADPAFVDGPVTVRLDVRAPPGDIVRVMLMGDVYFGTSPWTSTTPTEEFDPHAHVPGGLSEAACTPGVFDLRHALASFERALRVEIRVGADGSGAAEVRFTDERKWWRASADRTEVDLPRVVLADEYSCSVPRSDAGSGWSLPRRWSITVSASQEYLDGGDEVSSPRFDAGDSALFEENRAAAWTVTSADNEAFPSANPKYRLSTANTRSRAATMSFVAALLFGLALTGVFELARGASRDGRLTPSSSAPPSRPPRTRWRTPSRRPGRIRMRRPR